MKKILRHFPTFILAVLLTGCGGSNDSTEAQMPDPVSQPEANAAVFQRTCDGIIGLIERKDYQLAKEGLEAFKKFKLTPEQQKVVDRLQADISKASP
jgi:outer membrane PBP1 activator LpoA protein